MKTIATGFAAALFALSAGGAWALTDPQIAAIVVAANQADIDAGKLAQSKAQNKDVKAFADRMVTDHTAVLNSASELVQKLHVTPEANPTSEKLQKGGEENIAHLKTLEGSTFDKKYMDHEVYYHKAVLEEMDKRLIPDARNAELKALLVKVRPAFQAHLEHAQKVQKEVEVK